MAKSKSMQNMLSKVFPEETKQIEKGNCPFCKKKIDITTFKDSLSYKEFKISGLCQECQDETFGG